ncbi:MAG: glycosyltransferase family 1 protein [Gemmatimonadaceae bacterium]|nr:glycosyltransferase family 1 protein [Gemmatimonadaceae bacterium]
MLIIFSGTIGRSALGGQAWATMQYLAGFRQLGHDVFYLEDCGETSLAYNWGRQEPTYDLDYPSEFVRECLRFLDMEDRWIYRAGDGWRGFTLSDFQDVCSEASLMIMRATPMWTWRGEYARPHRRAFIDVDPGFTQFRLAGGHRALSEGLDRCERLFTLGQNIGMQGCTIPTVNRQWLKTLPPVSLPHWPAQGDREDTHFTSLIRWTGYREETFGGTTYGQRDMEFPKYLHLPQMVKQPLRMAAMGVAPEILEANGWDFVRGEEVSRTHQAYQRFIQRSRGEFLVPKHAYVSTRSGWFSDRSVCYLASGRPVLIEDTGLGGFLPLGNGLLTFSDPDSAARGLDIINEDYGNHCNAARKLAEQLFSAETVLPAFLEAALA